MSIIPIMLIEPMGGICNRLRAIVSAQVLAHDRVSSLYIIWKRDHHLSARFEELFVKPPDIRTVITIGNARLYGYFNAIVCSLFRRKLEQPDVEAMNRNHADYVRYAAGSSLFIRTYSRFHEGTDFSRIKPLPEIIRVVESYGLGTSEVVGVHIRRTDNQRSIACSPTDLFIAAMQAEIAKNESVRFFLATDSPEEEHVLRQTFPGRITVHPKTSLDRNEPRAIRDALVDLYCLAGCKRLIGSYWSSFTDTAAAIGGIPLLVIKKPDVD